MENWYALYETVKVQQKEWELQAKNDALVAYAQKDRQAFYRKMINKTGRLMESWGQELQKRFQTCY